VIASLDRPELFEVLPFSGLPAEAFTSVLSDSSASVIDEGERRLF